VVGHGAVLTALEPVEQRAIGGGEDAITLGELVVDPLPDWCPGQDHIEGQASITPRFNKYVSGIWNGQVLASHID